MLRRNHSHWSVDIYCADVLFSNVISQIVYFLQIPTGYRERTTNCNGARLADAQAAVSFCRSKFE